MKKLEKIDRQEQKAREQIAALHALLKEIDGQRTEQENLQIVQQIRALKLSRDELYSFLKAGELPAALTASLSSGNPSEPETVYSQNNRKRRNKRDSDNEQVNGVEINNADGGASDFESSTDNHTDNSDNLNSGGYNTGNSNDGYSTDSKITNYESEGISNE